MATIEQIEQNKRDIENKYSGSVRDNVFVGSKEEELQRTIETEQMIRRMGGRTEQIEALRRAKEYAAKETREREYQQYQHETAEFSKQVEDYNKQASTYNLQIDEVNRLLLGGDAVQTVNIKPTVRRSKKGKPIIGYYATIDKPVRGGTYLTGETKVDQYTEEQLERYGIEDVKSYWGLGPEDIIKVNGKVFQSSMLSPEHIELVNKAYGQQQEAKKQYEHEKLLEQDRLKTEWLFTGRGSWAQPAAFTEAYKARMGYAPSNALIDMPKYNISEPQLQAQKSLLGSTSAVWSGTKAYETEAYKMQARMGTITPTGTQQFKFSPLSEINIRPIGHQMLQDDKWEMPKEINPATGKRWTEPLPLSEQQKLMETDKARIAADWWGGKSRYEKSRLLLAGGWYNPEIMSSFIGTKLGGTGESKSLWEGLGLPTEKGLTSGITLIGGEMKGQKIDINYNTPSKPRYSELILDTVKSVKKKGVVEGYKESLTSPIATSLIGAAGVGLGLGLVSRAAPTAAKAAGLGAVGYIAGDIGYRGIQKDYGAAVTSAGMFALSAPFAVGGYRLGATTKLPAMKEMFGESKSPISKSWQKGTWFKPVSRSELTNTLKQDWTITEKLLGKSQTVRKTMPVSRSELTNTLKQDWTISQKMFGKSRTVQKPQIQPEPEYMPMGINEWVDRFNPAPPRKQMVGMSAEVISEFKIRDFDPLKKLPPYKLTPEGKILNKIVNYKEQPPQTREIRTSTGQILLQRTVQRTAHETLQKTVQKTVQRTSQKTVAKPQQILRIKPIYKTKRKSETPQINRLLKKGFVLSDSKKEMGAFGDYDYSNVYPKHSALSMFSITKQEPKTKLNTVSASFLGSKTDARTTAVQNQALKQLTKNLQKQDLKQLTTPLQNQAFIQLTQPIQKQSFKQLTKTIQRQVLKQLTKTQQKTPQRQRTPVRELTPQKPRVPKPPKIPQINFPSISSKSQKSSSKILRMFKGWKVRNPFLTFKNL